MAPVNIELDLSLFLFAAAAVLVAIGAWASGAWLVKRRIDDAFDEKLDAAQREATQRVHERTPDPLKRP